MSKKVNYAFLVRTDTGVIITFRQPKDVKILGVRTWCVWKNDERAFEYTESIGDNGSRFLSSNNYVGTIGVFDTSEPNHIKILAEMTMRHRLEQIGWDLQCELRGVFGEKVVHELSAQSNRGKRGSPRRRLSDKAQLYAESDRVIRKTCYGAFF